MSRDIQNEIDELVKSHRVVLFMKGNKLMPQCGFSANALGIVGSYTRDFEVVNVLQDGEIRQGIKEYASWPTIPQLYVNGEFVGGGDIVTEMHEAGELEGLLGAEAEAEA